jgi:hypothetical protein
VDLCQEDGLTGAKPANWQRRYWKVADEMDGSAAK